MILAASLFEKSCGKNRQTHTNGVKNLICADVVGMGNYRFTSMCCRTHDAAVAVNQDKLN